MNSPSSNPSLATLVIKSIAEALSKNPAELTPDKRLVEDLKVDSVDKFSILMTLEKNLDADIPDEELTGFVTIQDILDYVQNRNLHG